MNAAEEGGVPEDSSVQPNLGCQQEQHRGAEPMDCTYMLSLPGTAGSQMQCENKNRAQGNWKRNLALNIPTCFYFPPFASSTPGILFP